MFKKRENPDKLKAGALAVLVHLLLLGGMLISFNWKSAHPVLNVAEVELWDKAPAPKLAVKPEPTPEPIVKETPKPEPLPEVKPEPKPEEPKVDIELEAKKKQEAEKDKQQALEKQKEQEKQDALKKLEAQKLAEQKKKEERELKLKAMRDEDVASDKPNQAAIKQAQADVDAEANAAKSAASAGEINAYKAKIQAKIRGNVNKTLCADGNPKLRFTIALLPTGELNGAPKLIKSSGNSACDEAVERAIIASQPLPLPDDKSLFADNFRNLNLNFEPNKAD